MWYILGVCVFLGFCIVYFWVTTLQSVYENRTARQKLHNFFLGAILTLIGVFIVWTSITLIYTVLGYLDVDGQSAEYRNIMTIFFVVLVLCLSPFWAMGLQSLYNKHKINEEHEQIDNHEWTAEKINRLMREGKIRIDTSDQLDEQINRGG